MQTGVATASAQFGFGSVSFSLPHYSLFKPRTTLLSMSLKGIEFAPLCVPLPVYT